MHEQPNPSDHSQHDLLAVAALADRGATGDEADRARAQIDACGECAALHADLVSLAAATRQLPPIERPRDFQLRPADAQRLRPNRMRRLFGSFGTARDGFSRPLAMGLTTIGFAGLMLGILPGAIPLGGSAGAAAPSAPIQGTLEVGASAPADAAAGGVPAEAPQATDQERQNFDGGAAPIANPAPAGAFDGDNGAPVSIAGEHDTLLSVADDGNGVSQLVVISGTLLLAGLGLFTLRWASRRYGA